MSDLEERLKNDKTFNKIKQKLTVTGSDDQKLVNVLYGLNPYQNSVLPEMNDDDKVFVFFTRPDLNLSISNVKRDRKAIGILKNDESIQRYARLLLDPMRNIEEQSAVLDAFNPFMPVFSNTLETLSGFPDIVLESWISKIGIRKEQWGHSDGLTNVNYTFNLDATFTNIIDEPIPVILNIWMNYMYNVREGNFMPHKHNLISRKIDYQTAIWIIVTNRNKRIKKIARTIGYPIADPKGRYFNYSRHESKLQEAKKVNMRFMCFGVEYNDPILFLEFNTLMMSYHPAIFDTVINNTKSMREIPEEYMNLFKYRGYPFIDMKYNTLEYLIHEDEIKVKDIMP